MRTWSIAEWIESYHCPYVGEMETAGNDEVSTAANDPELDW